MIIIHQRHDNFIKAIMSHPAVAESFFLNQLPWTILDKIDLTTLKMEPTTFIDEKLRKHESDLIFSVKQTDGETSYLYLLLEHQSKSDPMMPFRLINYIMQGLKRHIKQKNKTVFPLPLIYPIVIFNGNHPWIHKREFFSLFGESEQLAKSIFIEPFHLVDTSAMHEEDFRKKQLSNLMLLSLYRANTIEFRLKTAMLIEHFRAFSVPPDSDLGRIVLEYNTSEFAVESSDTTSNFESYIYEFPQDFQEVIMNLKQAFVSEGRKLGISQGISQGKLEGISSMLSAIKYLKQGCSLAYISKTTNLSAETIEQLIEYILDEKIQVDA